MKESLGEDPASHPDPESCACMGNCAGEALTGAHAGRILSSEIPMFPGADVVLTSGRQHRGQLKLMRAANPAESKTLGMRGHSRRENRETPATPDAGKGGSVGEGLVPYGQHARGWGVGRWRSTDEVPEQGRVGDRRRRTWREGHRPRRLTGQLAAAGHRAGSRRHLGSPVCAGRDASTFVSEVRAV